MTPSLLASLWPASRAAQALAALARASDLPKVSGESPGTLLPPVTRDWASLERWLDTAARSLKLEVEPFHPTYREVDEKLRRAGPMLLTLGGGEELQLLPLVRLGRSRTQAQLLGPDGLLRKVALSEVCAALRSGIDEHAERRVELLLDRADVRGERRMRARDAILGEQLGGHLLDAGWAISLPPSAPFIAQLRHAGLPGRAVGIVALQLVIQALSLSAWWLVGKGALEGRLEAGWLVAWGMLLTTVIPLGSLASWWQGAATLEVAVLLKRRMLAGALHLEPEETRHQGSGQLLGRVIEAEALESLVTSGGLAGLLAIVELVIAGGVLAGGPAGGASALLLAAMVIVTLSAAWLYLRRLRAWTGARLAMTHDLVERMVGHRTRLAQEPRDAWHTAEDEQLAHYAESSAALDRLSTVLGAIPSLWLVLGLLSIVPAFASGQRTGGALAVGIGGVMLAYRAVGKLTAGANSLLGAQVAWSQAGELFRAGARDEPARRAALVAVGMDTGRGGALVEARDVFFRYPARREPVLRNLNLRIHMGDRLLLQGPSGGGKSTLGAILTGIRAPDNGLLLLGGLDRHTLGGHGWRRRVVAAPQFHENHVLSATFAFNLLMGRGWPARPKDLEDAANVCEELGLGGLIERMPAGLMQMVGETGWQLSHGERSRLFIARALLQEADMIVLDESFAALDPVTLERALRCVMARAPTLVVVAHP